MYLERLELIGFKSFAKKTVLKFAKPNQKKFNITAVVGPNGSGKSNLGESIRWALGEQSIKALRGKKSEDIIFSGSSQKKHLNSAEVILFFNNEDESATIDYKEFTITRKIYRNRENEYFINKNRVHLQDILLLMAKSNFGQSVHRPTSRRNPKSHFWKCWYRGHFCGGCRRCQSVNKRTGQPIYSRRLG